MLQGILEGIAVVMAILVLLVAISQILNWIG